MIGLPFKWVLGLAAVFVVSAVFVQLSAFKAVPLAEAATIGAGITSFDDLAERFTALADEKGAPYAFDVMRIAPLPPGIDTHLLGHEVGDILYIQEGIEGIKYCTQDFRNACSHTIVIGVLNEFGAGDATIKMIRDACKLAPGGSGAYTMCFHGLGHGVFAYFSYDIEEAVRFCKRLGTPEYDDQEYPQCVGGMIMELKTGGGHDADLWAIANKKYLTLDDPLAPCNRALIPAEVKNFCYMYLTPHLFEAAGADLGSPSPATFPRAFAFCDKAGDARLRDVCYGSFGKEFVPLAAARDIRHIDALSDETYATAISWCMLAPRSDAKAACVQQALASVFWGGENDPDASFRFCGLITDTHVSDACYAELAKDIAMYSSGETRTALCARLPDTYIDACVNTSAALQTPHTP